MQGEINQGIVPCFFSVFTIKKYLFLCKIYDMSLLFSSNATLHEIVTLVETLSHKTHAKFYARLNLSRPKLQAAKYSRRRKK
jgi:hypothetical protein